MMTSIIPRACIDEKNEKVIYLGRYITAEKVSYVIGWDILTKSKK
jgi:hypothetical protein